MERPIIHRYQEIEQFPQALNNSQLWNWNTRLFLTEAKANLTAEEEADLPSKWTAEELLSLEKTLKEHETWLNTFVEKQKKTKSWEDPAIETTEMRARAKVLEQSLHKLVRRKIPKAKKTTTATTSTTSEAAESTAAGGDDENTKEETTTTEVPPQQTATKHHVHEEL